MYKDPTSIEEAQAEIKALTRANRIAGRIFYFTFFAFILICFTRVRIDEDAQLMLCIGSGLLALLFAFGIIPVELPGRLGGRAFEDRIKYLEGYIKGKEDNS